MFSTLKIYLHGNRAVISILELPNISIEINISKIQKNKEITMELITNEESYPALCATEDIKRDEKIILLRFYEESSGWEWYLCEYDPDDKIAFGYVRGYASEWGYFSLTEMQEIPTIKRDYEFEPTKFKELYKKMREDR